MQTHLFSSYLLDWFDVHGRKDLPWQHPRTPYRVWVSEIMLQQTQVQTVVAYFERFMARFESVQALATAPLDDVLSVWSGLGYYSRARNLHRTAELLIERFQGEFPDDMAILETLPGIGESTAAAIVSQAFNRKAAILDGNVKRVLARCFNVDGYPNQAQTKKRLQALASACMPEYRAADYTQAIMDLGATCCTPKKPQCHACPMQKGCDAYALNLTDTLPQKKPKKTIPFIQKQFLVLTRPCGKIYLHQHPPKGLWGGLWCLPEVDMLTEPQTFVTKKLKFTLLKQIPLLRFTHAFSHFKLDIHSVHCMVGASHQLDNEPPGQWYTPKQALQLGLAKPVRTIIEAVISSSP